MASILLQLVSDNDGMSGEDSLRSLQSASSPMEMLTACRLVSCSLQFFSLYRLFIDVCYTVLLN